LSYRPAARARCLCEAGPCSDKPQL